MAILSRHLRGLFVAIVAALIITTSVSTVTADPVPIPPEPPAPPAVFCFRITDIQPTFGDPEGDSWDVEFQVLNWTNRYAGGVMIALNTGTGHGGVADQEPRFNGATIDTDGRPLFGAADPPPGNNAIPNDWTLLDEFFGIPADSRDPANLPSETMVVWAYNDTPIFPEAYAGGGGTPIPPVNLLGPPSLQPDSPELAFMDFTDPADVNSTVIETIDDGPNVMDGFVVTIDDWDAGEIISFNWYLLDDFLFPLGIPGSPFSTFNNGYGFGTVNLARIDDGTTVPSEVFGPNTGFNQSPMVFFGNVNTPIPVQPSLQEGAIAQAGPEFTGEFGAGISGEFLDDGDNVFFIPNDALLAPNDATAIGLFGAASQAPSYQLALIGIAILTVSVGLMLAARLRRD